MISIPNYLSTDNTLSNKNKSIVILFYRICGNARLKKIIKISDIQARTGFSKPTIVDAINKISMSKLKYIDERNELNIAGKPYEYKMFYPKIEDKKQQVQNNHVLISEEYIDMLLDKPDLLIDYIKIKQASWYFEKSKHNFQESLERFGMSLHEFNCSSLKLAELGIVSEYFFPPPVFVESNGTKLFNKDENQPIINQPTKTIDNTQQVTEQPKQTPQQPTKTLTENELSALRRQVEECTDSINFHEMKKNQHARQLRETVALHQKQEEYKDLTKDQVTEICRQNENFRNREIEWAKCSMIIDRKKEKLQEAKEKLFDFGYSI